MAPTPETTRRPTATNRPVPASCEAWICSCNGTLPLSRPSDLPEGVRLRTFRLLCRQAPPPPEVPVFVGCARGTGRLLSGWEAGGLPVGRAVAWDLPPAPAGLSGAGARRLAGSVAAAGAALAAAALPPAVEELPPLSRVAVVGPLGRGTVRALAGPAEVVWIAPEAEPGSGWAALPADPAGVVGRLGAFRIALAAPHPVDPWACVGCGACARVCPTGALGEDLRFLPDRCDRCGRCEAACAAAGAIDLGRPPTVEADLVVWPGGVGTPRPGLFLPPGPDEIPPTIARVLDLVRGAVAWAPLARPPEHCAHRAAGFRGCSRCLDACPTGALSGPSGRVERDPLGCSGCGACVAACPTGQMDARPWPREALNRTLEALGRSGIPLQLSCIHGVHRRTDAAVRIPLDHLAGPDAWGLAAAVLAGAPWIRFVPCPACAPVALTLRRDSEAVLERAGLGGRILLDEEARGSPLRGRTPLPAPPPGETTLDRRARVLRAVWEASPGAPALDGPFGSLRVRGRCTACGACAGVCPTGALVADRDAPVLRFTEVRCVGCGLCIQACPESALEMERRFRWAEGAFGPRVLFRADAHACPSCGRVFATREAIKAVAERLRARGFGGSGLLELCPDCRAVRALAEGVGSRGDSA